MKKNFLLLFLAAALAAAGANYRTVLVDTNGTLVTPTNINIPQLNIVATNFIGNGGGLTNIQSAKFLTVSNAVGANTAMHAADGHDVQWLNPLNEWFFDDAILAPSFTAQSGTFNGNLIGNASLATNAADGYPAASTAYVDARTNWFQFATNFHNRNCRYVDAGNGSDLNDGSENYPFATVQYGQTHIAAGWTLALAPGSYADTITNGQINYWLANGATVTASFGWDCTNAIDGYGNVTMIASDEDSNPNANVTIHCHSFNCHGEFYLCITNFSERAFLNVTSDSRFYSKSDYADCVDLQDGDITVIADILYLDFLYTSDGVSLFLKADKAFCGGDVEGDVNSISGNDVSWEIGTTFIPGNATLNLNGPNITFVGNPIFQTTTGATLTFPASNHSGSYQILP